MKKILLTTIIMGMGAGLIGCTQASQNSSQTAQNNTQTVQSNESVNTQTDNTVAKENVSKKITVDEAKKIALNHANLTSKEVSFINAEADMDNGVEFYDIEFYNNNKEYDYEISAADGKIIEYDYDVEGYGESTNVSNNNSSNTNKQNSNKSNTNTTNNKANNNQNTNTNSNTSSNKISADKAKKIALNHANLTSNQVSYIQVEADFDDYTPSYDVEFYYNNVEYSYEINANDGNIISFEKDID